MAGKLGIDRLAYWANQYGFGQQTGIDLPGEVSRHRPDERVEAAGEVGEKIFPGEVYQAGIGQGYDVVTPIQLINAYARARQRRQALSAAARPRRRRARRQRRPPVPAEAHPQARRRRRACSKTMRAAARSVVTLRHTYNLVDLPIIVAGKSGTAEFGTRDSKGPPARSTRGSSGSRRRTRTSMRTTRRPEGAGEGRLAARGPRVRLRLADEGQRRRPRS